MEHEGVLKGKSTKAKAAGAVFMGSLMVKLPKQGKTIQAIFDIKKKELSNCITAIRRLYPNFVENQRPVDYTIQAANKMELPPDVRTAAAHVAEKITELELATGKQPQTIAGVALFIVTQLSVDKRSLTEIAGKVEITEQTIKQAYKDIYHRERDIIPQFWKTKEVGLKPIH